MSSSAATTEQLIDHARRARLLAHAPYSRFLVGAAILGADGRIYVGCNVENASYGLTICAERTAAVSMVAAGCKQIAAVAIVLSGNGSPCGACRQFLVEFGDDFPVTVVDAEDLESRRTWTIDQLLPAAFKLS